METVFEEFADKKQLLITRAFDGPKYLVWKAWTTSELLDKWWAPEGWKSETKIMDFKVGGYRLYCMEGENGNGHWGKETYLSIVSEKSFEADVIFCDEAGVRNPDLPIVHWNIGFHDTPSGTKVSTMHTFESEKEMRAYIEMGLKEGTMAVYDRLDQLLIEIGQSASN